MKITRYKADPKQPYSLHALDFCEVVIQGKGGKKGGFRGEKLSKVMWSIIRTKSKKS